MFDPLSETNQRSESYINFRGVGGAGATALFEAVREDQIGERLVGTDVDETVR